VVLVFLVFLFATGYAIGCILSDAANGVANAFNNWRNNRDSEKFDREWEKEEEEFYKKNGQTRSEYLKNNCEVLKYCRKGD
jgi:hypothetical protein